MMTTSRERVIGESIFLLLGLLTAREKGGVMSRCNAIIFCMRMYWCCLFHKVIVTP